MPIWIGGESKPALRRAAQWDGWVIGGDDQEGKMIKRPEDVAVQLSYIEQHRTSPQQFEVGLSGVSTNEERRLVQEFGAIGVTWWLESIHGYRGTFEEMLGRITAGPPV